MALTSLKKRQARQCSPLGRRGISEPKGSAEGSRFSQGVLAQSQHSVLSDIATALLGSVVEGGESCSL